MNIADARVFIYAQFMKKKNIFWKKTNPSARRRASYAPFYLPRATHSEGERRATCAGRVGSGRVGFRFAICISVRAVSSFRVGIKVPRVGPGHLDWLFAFQFEPIRVSKICDGSGRVGPGVVYLLLAFQFEPIQVSPASFQVGLKCNGSGRDGSGRVGPPPFTFCHSTSRRVPPTSLKNATRTRRAPGRCDESREEEQGVMKAGRRRRG